MGYWYAGAIVWACFWLGITMLLAFLAHIRVKDSMGKSMPPLVFLAIIIILIIINI
ncbi:DoxX family protein [Bacillus sp. V3-13]|uniref:DoxX family protein n=1 Tax=Bacillus sp. V3-13 TaxID=2053728 RepID=UPI0035B4FBCB